MGQYKNNREKPIETLCLCRVSSEKQAKNETIVSQKQQCMNYARNNNFKIDQFFYEEAVSGWKGKRAGLEEMGEYIRHHHKTKQFRVLFYDISRVARNILTYALFEQMVNKYNIEWQTVTNGKYTKNASGCFMWRLDALNAQRFSEELSEKTKGAMRSLMTLGYYPLNPPLGLKRQKDEHNKVVLVRDEPRASIILQMFEKYASGEIATKHAATMFLSHFDVWNGRRLSDSQVNDMLHNEVYTGFFAYDRWDIPHQEWKMEKLVPIEVFNRVQERLNRSGRQQYKSNNDDAFPLRHVVCCELCGHPLTGYYAKSGTKGRMHPYYRCYNKACAGRKHSIRKQCVESALVAKLATLNVSDAFLNLCGAMITKVGEMQIKQEQREKDEIRQQIAEIDMHIQHLSGLVARSMAKNDTDMVEIYEQQIKDKNATKRELEKRVSGISVESTREKFLTAMKRGRNFFKRPVLLWTHGNVSQKRRLVRLVFTEKPTYCATTGFLTASTPQIFNKNTAQMDGDSILAAPLGFEPGFSP